jgi:hypothetical protein
MMTGEAVTPGSATGGPDAGGPEAGDEGGTSPGLEDLADLKRGPLAALIHVRQFPGRLRCATLGWETLRRALDSS